MLYSQQSNVALFMFAMAVAQLKLSARHPGYDPTAYHARSGRKSRITVGRLRTRQGFVEFKVSGGLLREVGRGWTAYAYHAPFHREVTYNDASTNEM